MKYFGSIGPVSVELEGVNKGIVDYIVDELSLISSQNNSVKPDICIRVVESLSSTYKPSYFAAKGKLNFNDTGYFVGYNKLYNYVCNTLSDGTIELLLEEKSSLRTRISLMLKSLLLPKHDAATQVASQMMSYSGFWYVFNSALLNKGSAFIHAGILLNDNDEAIVLTGTGGSGKTSTSFSFVNEGYNYLAEDFGIVLPGGYTTYNPKSISLYNSDMTTGIKIFRDFYTDSFGVIDKLKWKLTIKLLKLNPMVKVNPKDIGCLPPQQEKFKVKSTIFLTREKSTEFSFKKLAIEEMIERVFHSSYREMKVYDEIMKLLYANSTKVTFPTQDTIEKKHKAVYQEFLRNTDNYIVTIPHESTPDEVKEFLMGKGVI